LGGQKPYAFSGTHKKVAQVIEHAKGIYAKPDVPFQESLMHPMMKQTEPLIKYWAFFCPVQGQIDQGSGSYLIARKGYLLDG